MTQDPSPPAPPRTRARVLAVGAVLLLLLGTAPAAAAPRSTRLLYRIADPRITEASGIAVGIASPGIDYVNNDSGDRNRFFALDARSGATVATITVAGAGNVDWEDIAVARDAAGTPSVWLADIGDNQAARPEVRVYRVDEPRIRPGRRGRTLRTARADVWRLRYPQGAVDAESLAVAPGGPAYVITKSLLGRSAAYRLPNHPDRGRVQVLRRVGSIQLTPTGTANPFGLPGQLAVTGAAISADGSVLAVRTYADAYVWPLARGGVPAALRRRPFRVALPEQRQGEGIAVGGAALLVDSEGIHSAVYRVALPAAAPSPGRSSPVPASTRPGARRDRPPAGLIAGSVAGALLLGAAAWWLVRRRARRPD